MVGANHFPCFAVGIASLVPHQLLVSCQAVMWNGIRRLLSVRVSWNILPTKSFCLVMLAHGVSLSQSTYSATWKEEPCDLGFCWLFFICLFVCLFVCFFLNPQSQMIWNWTWTQVKQFYFPTLITGTLQCVKSHSPFWVKLKDAIQNYMCVSQFQEMSYSLP